MLSLWSFSAFIMMLSVMPLEVLGFAPSIGVRKLSSSSPFGILQAGGFEWEDPTKIMDQGVENPYKNPDLTNGEDGLKIDPARLLGPRLNGANIYFIGMMGCGKTSVGDCVARRKFHRSNSKKDVLHCTPGALLSYIFLVTIVCNL